LATGEPLTATRQWPTEIGREREREGEREEDRERESKRGRTRSII
jgi:hypothetical protein